jgi:hypothetical protein
MMQPYAWLFSNGLLTIDDRAWETRYRGSIAIHASKRFHLEYYDFVKNRSGWNLPAPKDYETGGVVGVAKLVDCVKPNNETIDGLTDAKTERSHFGASGFYGFVFKDAKPLGLVKVRGMPGIFEVDDGLLSDIAKLKTLNSTPLSH